MKVFCQYILLSAWMIFFVSCGANESEDSGPESSRYEIVIDNQPLELAFSEGPMAMDQIIRIEYLDENSSIVLDRSGRFHLFRDYTFVKLIGAMGSGPCEYGTATSFTVVDGTLYLTDRSLSKIIAYDIDSNQCIRENVYEGVRGMTSIGVSGTDIFVTNGILVRSHLETDTPFLYRLDASGDTETIDFYAHDLEALLLPSPVQIHANMRVREGTFYMYYPLSPKIFMYSPERDTIPSFSMPFDLSDITPGEMQDPNEMIEAINETEMVLGIHTLDEFIAVVTKQGVLPDRVFRIKFIDYDGSFIDSVETPSYVVYVGNDHFVSLHTDTTRAAADTPNKVVRQEYKLQEVLR